MERKQLLLHLREKYTSVKEVLEIIASGLSKYLLVQVAALVFEAIRGEMSEITNFKALYETMKMVISDFLMVFFGTLVVGYFLLEIVIVRLKARERMCDREIVKEEELQQRLVDEARVKQQQETERKFSLQRKRHERFDLIVRLRD